MSFDDNTSELSKREYLGEDCSEFELWATVYSDDERTVFKKVLLCSKLNFLVCKSCVDDNDGESTN